MNAKTKIIAQVAGQIAGGLATGMSQGELKDVRAQVRDVAVILARDIVEQVIATTAPPPGKDDDLPARKPDTIGRAPR